MNCKGIIILQVFLVIQSIYSQTILPNRQNQPNSSIDSINAPATATQLSFESQTNNLSINQKRFLFSQVQIDQNTKSIIVIVTVACFLGIFLVKKCVQKITSNEKRQAEYQPNIEQSAHKKFTQEIVPQSNIISVIDVPSLKSKYLVTNLQTKDSSFEETNNLKINNENVPKLQKLNMNLQDPCQ